MNKKILILMLITISVITSCSSSRNTTLSKGVDITKYKYVVFGKEQEGDRSLDDIVLMVQNEISERLEVVSPSKAKAIISSGGYVVSPHINVQTQYWDGGHTFITISFYDYNTNQMIAVAKSSGIGLSISDDQSLAIKAIKKELKKIFPKDI